MQKTRKCSACQRRKPLREFHKKSWHCKRCKSVRSRKARQGDVRYTLWDSARRRASQRGLPFTITVEDVVVPTYCPIFGIKLVPGVGRQSPNSPSLDRIIPKKGYVPGNVQVISWRANSLKKDANLRELADLGQFAVKALEARRGRACGLR